VNQVIDTVILLLIIATVVVAAICGRKPKSQSAHRGQKRTGRLYHDYDQFQLAMQVWEHDRLLFEQNETARLARSNQKVQKGGAFSTCCLFGVVIVALVVGFSDGAATGWGFLLLGMLPIAIMMTIEKKFYRWRHEALFVRKEFGEPQPVYHLLVEPANLFAQRNRLALHRLGTPTKSLEYHLGGSRLKRLAWLIASVWPNIIRTRLRTSAQNCVNWLNARQPNLIWQ
jgi:hypothetical protein